MKSDTENRLAAREREATDRRDTDDRWDWSSTMFVMLVVIVVLVLTFEIWAPHFGANH